MKNSEYCDAWTIQRSGQLISTECSAASTLRLYCYLITPIVVISLETGLK